MHARLRRGPVPAPDNFLAIDETNASAAIKISGRAFVNVANDTYSGIVTTRYNRSRIVRVSNFTPDIIYFQAQGVPGSDGNLAVLVNGTLFQNVVVTNSDALPRMYSVSGMGTATKTIDFVEDFQERLGALNSGVDGSCPGVYVLRVLVPTGASVSRATWPVGIAAFGNSHMDGDANVPCSYYGWVGQLRRAGNALGVGVGYVGAGSSTLCGDGPTPQQTGAMIHDTWASLGCTTKKLLMFKERNDYAYYGTGLSTTPTVWGQYAKDIHTYLDSSDPGWTGIYSRIPQGSSWGANGGGFTLDDYWAAIVSASTFGGRTNIQTFDKTVFTAINLATDYFEAPNGQVHLIQAGHDKVFAVARTWYGI